MTPDEIRQKTEKELVTLREDLQEEFFKLVLQNATGQLEKSHRLKELKKDIARVMTIAKEKSAAKK